MAYGTIKVDNITFTSAGADQFTTVSGIYRAITSGVTVSGTISGNTIQGQTISGLTITGTTIQGASGTFTSLTGITTTGTTASFTSGIFGTGSATAPSVSVGTGTTYSPGIYSPGTDQLAISTSGSGRLFINSSGSVGVGSSSPQNPLVVSNGGANGFEISSATNSGTTSYLLSYNRSTSAYTDIRFDASAFRFEVSATERMRIDSSGRLLVGTNTAAPSLVAGGCIGLDSTTGRKLDLYYSATTHMGLGVDIGGGPYELSIYGPTGNVNQGKIAFGFISEANPGTWTEAMRLVASGRVGIGTASPGDTLHVSGSIRADVDLKTINQGKLNLGSNQGGGAVLVYNSNGNLDIAPRSGFSTTFLASDGGTERARIDSSGRLLVGTSSTSANTTALFQGYGGVPTGGAHLRLAAGTNSPASGANLGLVLFSDSEHTNCAYISGDRDGGTWSASSKPTRLVFSTTADGASSPTERVRIPSGGGLCVGSTVNPNALTQASGIRLGDNTLASYTFANITTSPVTIANGVGIGGLAFVQAYNTSNGAQYTGLIMWRSGVVAVVSESNALGFALTYSVSGSTLLLQTASGTITGSVITLAG